MYLYSKVRLRSSQRAYHLDTRMNYVNGCTNPFYFLNLWIFRPRVAVSSKHHVSLSWSLGVLVSKSYSHIMMQVECTWVGHACKNYLHLIDQTNGNPMELKKQIDLLGGPTILNFRWDVYLRIVFYTSSCANFSEFQ